MSIHDTTYKQLVLQVATSGEFRQTRSGPVISLFAPPPATYDLIYGLPLLTTKKMQTGSIVKELLWFLRGETNIKTLGCGIWDEWAREDGDCGPIYGKQWRDFGGVDQIKQVVDQINQDPESRRHIVSAWNPPELGDMVLPPCHLLFQFYVRRGRWLDCQLYQRSADLALGVPFNIASYAILMMLVARATGLTAGKLTHVLGDAHIYYEHREKLRVQVGRTGYSAPWLMIDPKAPVHPNDWHLLKPEHFTFVNYMNHPAVSYPIAV